MTTAKKPASEYAFWRPPARGQAGLSPCSALRITDRSISAFTPGAAKSGQPAEPELARALPGEGRKAPHSGAPAAYAAMLTRRSHGGDKDLLRPAATGSTGARSGLPGGIPATSPKCGTGATSETAGTVAFACVHQRLFWRGEATPYFALALQDETVFLSRHPVKLVDASGYALRHSVEITPGSEVRVRWRADKAIRWMAAVQIVRLNEDDEVRFNAVEGTNLYRGDR